MNETLTLTVEESPTLNFRVASLLKKEIGTAGIIVRSEPDILINISLSDYEQRLGNILQQIYSIVEQHFPVRTEHILLTICDVAGVYKNIFKIWKSA